VKARISFISLQYWLPVIIMCIMIFVLSEKGGDIYIPPIPYIDKFLHIALYSVLALFYCRAHKWQWRTFVFPGTIIFTIAYGISDEIHQYFVPHRNPEITDILADGIGGLMGYYAYCFLIPGLIKQANNGPRQYINH